MTLSLSHSKVKRIKKECRAILKQPTNITVRQIAKKRGSNDLSSIGGGTNTLALQGISRSQKRCSNHLRCFEHIYFHFVDMRTDILVHFLQTPPGGLLLNCLWTFCLPRVNKSVPNHASTFHRSPPPPPPPGQTWGTTSPGHMPNRRSPNHNTCPL